MASITSFRSLAGRAAKGACATAGLGFAGTAAGTWYCYKTDESWKRCIDFHIKVAPMCWDYMLVLGKYADPGLRQPYLEVLHNKYAPKCLQDILDLGGYYVKCSQLLCGMNLLPQIYEKEFSVLLDAVPTYKNMETVRGIVESELGGKLEDHFSEFSEIPIAAASIGQVHTAKLVTGRPPSATSGRNHDNSTQYQEVVVKVQYPEVEKYFRLDVLSMKNLVWLCQKCGVDTGMDETSLDKIFGEFTKSFEEEFDYRLEARNMEDVRENMCGPKSSLPDRLRTRVVVPRAFADKTTRKVLTMEKLQGMPIKKKMRNVMESVAKSEGKSLKAYEEEMRHKFSDPAQLKIIMKERRRPDQSSFIGKMVGKMNYLLASLYLRLFCYNSGIKSSDLIDPSDIVPLLFDLHAHQLFIDGVFNADPHAGNVLVFDDGRVGLLDFGNVQRIGSEQRRADLAKFYLSMSIDFSDQQETWNDAQIARAFTKVGGISKKNDTRFLAANALSGYDMRMDPATLERFGVKDGDWANLKDSVFVGVDEFLEFPADLINLQRLCQTLVGVAGGVGFGAVSCSRMWEPVCREIV